MESVTMTLESFVSLVSTWFTAVVGWMGDLVSFITENPVVLLIVIIMPVTGFAVGLLSRMFSLRS